MKYLSVLTPPFLICAVVVIAVVAFLRHEMGRGGRDEADGDDGISAAPLQPGEEDGNEHTPETDGAEASPADG